MITPLQMGIMLSAYTGCKQYDCDETETWREQCTSLIDNDLIILLTSRVPNYRFALTEKGKFWIKTVLDTPFPVQVTNWLIPPMTIQPVTFKATTPDEMRLEIINWLLCQAVHYRIDAALAKRKTVNKKKTLKAQTYNDIAGFLSRIVIINSKEETKDEKSMPSQG